MARLPASRLHESYFTTFWLPAGARPAHAVEEAVRAVARHVPVRCAGVEWWIGRAYTTDVPIGFHFDQDVHGKQLRHPLVSSVLFFNRVRGGQLAVTDQRAGPKGRAVPAQPSRLEAVPPRANRYAIFDGRLMHGVLDARGQTPGKKLPGPGGRLRVTLVVNYWAHRPTDVPMWGESRAYRVLGNAGTPYAIRRANSELQPRLAWGIAYSMPDISG